MNPSRLAAIALATLFVTQLSIASNTAPVVAMVQGKPIMEEELDNRAAPELRQLNSQVFEIKQHVLSALIDERLLSNEATHRKLAVTQLLDLEVNTKVRDPTAAEIESYYREEKITRPLDEIRPQIAGFLLEDRRRTGYLNYIAQLRSAAKIVVFLDPPRIAVTMDPQRVRGPTNAPITIVEFSDFECPYCGEAEDTLRKVVLKYPTQIRLAYRDFPLPFHPHAALAAEASRCASAQGAYWTFHDLLFVNQQRLAIDDLLRLAAQLGLDTNKFGWCLKNKTFAADIQHDLRDGQELGLTGTPAFFVNGIAFDGALSFEEFSGAIDQELDRLRTTRR
jgi:protein-disulfide isomerase